MEEDIGGEARRGQSSRGRKAAPRRRARAPLEEVDFGELYSLEEIPVDTEDGWRLTLTRYRPHTQPVSQPLRGVPLLLVHGYTQNRSAWSSV